MSTTFFFMSSTNEKGKIFMCKISYRATSISALALGSGAPTHILMCLNFLFIGVFTAAKRWEAAEVEDISVLKLDRDCICGSNFCFAMDNANKVACTLTFFVRWLWIDATTEACVWFISVDIWSWLSIVEDEILLRLREYSYPKQNSRNIHSPLFECLVNILRS